MTEIQTSFDGQITVPLTYDRLYEKLTDIPFIASHYPDVASIEPYENGYLWTMNKIGAGKFSFQITYANHYPQSKEERRISWEPIHGIGNAKINGRWGFDPQGENTKLDFHTTLKIELSISKLFKKPAEAVLTAETKKRMGEYLSNLSRTLNGGNGVINHF